MPGDGAKDTTYIIGHTYRGDVKGVFDDLQYVKPGTPVRLTTSEGQLDYCVHDVLPPILKDQILDPTRGDVWNILPYSAQGDWVVFIACFLNDDGSPQDHNIVVRAKRGPC